MEAANLLSRLDDCRVVGSRQDSSSLDSIFAKTRAIIPARKATSAKAKVKCSFFRGFTFLFFDNARSAYSLSISRTIFRFCP